MNHFRIFINSKFCRLIKIKFLFFVFLTVMLRKIFLLQLILFPLEQISTQFHEVGHCTVSTLFGGPIFGINLYFGGGGYCMAFPPTFFPHTAQILVAIFGHGSEVFLGGLLFLIANGAGFETARKVSYAIAVFIFITSVFSRSVESLIVILINGFVFLMITHLSNESASRLALKFLGVYLVVNCIYNVSIYYNFSDDPVINGIVAHSDPKRLAILTGYSELFWVKFWMGFASLALLILWYFDQNYDEDELFGMTLVLANDLKFGRITSSGDILQIRGIDGEKYLTRFDPQIFQTDFDKRTLKCDKSTAEFLKICTKTSTKWDPE